MVKSQKTEETIPVNPDSESKKAVKINLEEILSIESDEAIKNSIDILKKYFPNLCSILEEILSIEPNTAKEILENLIVDIKEQDDLEKYINVFGSPGECEKAIIMSVVGKVTYGQVGSTNISTEVLLILIIKYLGYKNEVLTKISEWDLSDNFNSLSEENKEKILKAEVKNLVNGKTLGEDDEKRLSEQIIILSQDQEYKKATEQVKAEERRREEEEEKAKRELKALEDKNEQLKNEYEQALASAKQKCKGIKNGDALKRKIEQISKRIKGEVFKDPIDLEEQNKVLPGIISALKEFNEPNKEDRELENILGIQNISISPKIDATGIYKILEDIES